MLPFSYTSWLVPLKATTQPPSMSVFILPPGLRIDADERRYAVCLCGGDCTEAPGGSQHGRSASVPKRVAPFLSILISPLRRGLIGWYTYGTKSGPDELIRAGTVHSPESVRHDMQPHCRRHAGARYAAADA